MIHPQIWWGWRAVKSGEESAATLHASKQLYISYLRYTCEGWRVFLKVAFYPPAAWNFHPVFSTPSAKIHNRKGVSKFSSLSHAHSAPFGKNPKGVWEKAWEKSVQICVICGTLYFPLGVPASTNPADWLFFKSRRLKFFESHRFHRWTQILGLLGLEKKGHADFADNADFRPVRSGITQIWH